MNNVFAILLHKKQSTVIQFVELHPITVSVLIICFINTNSTHRLNEFICSAVTAVSPNR